MKNHFAILFGILIAFVFACSNDENPDPTCEDGIMNGGETGIDCGGDCDACFVCTTTYCSLLAGATTNEEQTSKVWQAIGRNWKFTFQSNGVFHEEYSGYNPNGTWEFDDPVSPTRLKFHYITIDGISTINSNLLKLVSDTLIIEDEYGDSATFLRQ
jgi:hypothetical protein